MIARLRTRLADVLSLLATAPSWRPHHVLDWCKTCLTRGERKPLEESMPWLAWPCIDWLERSVCPGMKVLEYGGGGSTLFFLAHHCRVTTVEGNSTWANAIRSHATAVGQSLEVRYVNSQSSDPELRREYASQAAIGGPWELILVDGAFRADCLAVARRHIAPGGIIVVDNTDLPEYADVHADRVLADFERKVFRGLGYARRRATTTEVYRARLSKT